MSRQKVTELRRYFVRVSIYSDSKYNKKNEKVSYRKITGGTRKTIIHKPSEGFTEGLKIQSYYTVFTDLEKAKLYLDQHDRKFNKAKKSKSIDCSIQAFRGRVNTRTRRIIGEITPAAKITSTKRETRKNALYKNGISAEFLTKKGKCFKELEKIMESKQRSIIKIKNKKVYRRKYKKKEDE